MASPDIDLVGTHSPFLEEDRWQNIPERFHIRCRWHVGVPESHGQLGKDDLTLEAQAGEVGLLLRWGNPLLDLGAQVILHYQCSIYILVAEQ